MRRLLVIRGPDIARVAGELAGLGFSFQIVSPEHIDEDRIIREIRLIPPQVRGRIRFGRGRPLPITRRGNLNYRNTSIVLVYEDDRLVDVFPKQLGSRYISALEGIRSLKEKPRGHVYEEPLIELLRQAPHLLLCRNVVAVHRVLYEGGETVGEIDLLLEDEAGGVLVEVEEEISESDVGQVLKLARRLEERNVKLSRLVLVGMTAGRGAVDAARRAGVEVWIARFSRIA